jgi:protein-arginine kinase activator protein McsA
MIRVFRLPNYNGATRCENCQSRASARLSVVRSDGGALVGVDFCDRCAKRASDALMDRERKKALKDLLGKPWKSGK